MDKITLNGETYYPESYIKFVNTTLESLKTQLQQCREQNDKLRVVVEMIAALNFPKDDAGNYVVHAWVGREVYLAANEALK